MNAAISGLVVCVCDVMNHFFFSSALHWWRANRHGSALISVFLSIKILPFHKIDRTVTRSQRTNMFAQCPHFAATWQLSCGLPNCLQKNSVGSKAALLSHRPVFTFSSLHLLSLPTAVWQRPWPKFPQAAYSCCEWSGHDAPRALTESMSDPVPVYITAHHFLLPRAAV